MLYADKAYQRVGWFRNPVPGDIARVCGRKSVPASPGRFCFLVADSQQRSPAFASTSCPALLASLREIDKPIARI